MNFDEPTDPFERQSSIIPEGLLAKTKKAQHQDEFKHFDVSRILKMDDRSLLEWQSAYEKDEPQWKLAELELQKRATKPTRKIAICALVVSILSFLWSFVSSLLK